MRIAVRVVPGILAAVAIAASVAGAAAEPIVLAGTAWDTLGTLRTRAANRPPSRSAFPLLVEFPTASTFRITDNAGLELTGTWTASGRRSQVATGFLDAPSSTLLADGVEQEVEGQLGGDWEVVVTEDQFRAVALRNGTRLKAKTRFVYHVTSLDNGLSVRVTQKARTVGDL